MVEARAFERGEVKNDPQFQFLMCCLSKQTSVHLIVFVLLVFGNVHIKPQSLLFCVTRNVRIKTISILFIRVDTVFI